MENVVLCIESDILLERKLRSMNDGTNFVSTPHVDFPKMFQDTTGIQHGKEVKWITAHLPVGRGTTRLGRRVQVLDPHHTWGNRKSQFHKGKCTNKEKNV